MNAADSEQGAGLSFAAWVRDMLALMRSGQPNMIALFESSVPEPEELLAPLLRKVFAQGYPDTYKSVFMRNHPDLGVRLAERYRVDEASILITTGATMAVSLVYGALLKPGQRVLVENPGFDIFAALARDAGARVDLFRREAPDFGIRADHVLEALRPDTRMVVLTNLHNPSGRHVSEAVLADLAGQLAGRDVILVLDEVYRDYQEAPGPGLDPRDHANVIRISSLTKMFGLSTLRCGWLFAGEGVHRRLRAYADRQDFSVSRLTHCVSAEILARGAIFDGWRRSLMQASRPVMLAGLEEMGRAGLTPDTVLREGCTCFPRLEGIGDTAKLSQWLLHHYGVVVAPGECFGMPGAVRIGYAVEPGRLSEALDRLVSGLTEYRAVHPARQRA